MKKTVPVYLKGKQIYSIDNVRPLVSRAYEKFWRLYNIHKIYHVNSPMERIVIEAK